MAGALVQAPTPTDSAGVSSLNRTFASDTTTGNLITAGAATWRGSSPGNINSCTDNKSNTYTPFTAEVTVATLTKLRGYYVANATGGASHQVTMGWSTSSNASLGCAEWSGVEASPTVVANTATGNGTAVSVSATAGAASLYVGVCTYASSSTTIAVNGSTQAWEADENSDNQAQNCAYRLSLTGANSVAWTLGATRDWGAYAAAFTESGGGGRTTRNTRSHPLGQRVGMGWRMA